MQSSGQDVIDGLLSFAGDGDYVFTCDCNFVSMIVFLCHLSLEYVFP